MAETVDVPCRSVRKNDSIVHLKITSFANRLINCLLDESSIPVVNCFQELGISGFILLRIETKDAEVLLRPEDLSGRHIPTPTTCVAYSLPFGQVRFTAAHFLF